MESAVVIGHQMDKEFGFYHTGHDDVSPDVQSNFVAIQGMNGTIDLTEQDGMVFYDSVDKEIRFERVTRVTSVDDVDKWARILRNKFSGREGKIVFDNDPDFYLWVRIIGIDVSCEEQGRIVALFRVHAQPFRMMVNETIISKSVSGSSQITLQNIKMPVSPYVTVDSQMTLVYTIRGNEYTTTINAGTHIIDTLVLFEGRTEITVQGTGNITFRYRQGSL